MFASNTVRNRYPTKECVSYVCLSAFSQLKWHTRKALFTVPDYRKLDLELFECLAGWLVGWPDLAASPSVAQFSLYSCDFWSKGPHLATSQQQLQWLRQHARFEWRFCAAGNDKFCTAT